MTETSNAVICDLRSTILTKSLPSPVRSNTFSVQCFQFVFQYDVDLSIQQIYRLSTLPPPASHSLRGFIFSHLIVVVGFTVLINLHEASNPITVPAESIFLPAALEELGAMVYGSDLINALPKVTLDT